MDKPVLPLDYTTEREGSQLVGYILTAVLSLAAGAALHRLHRAIVNREVRLARAEERKAAEALRADMEIMRRRYEGQICELESQLSYKRGRISGREEGLREGMNASNVQKLERALAGNSGSRTVQIGGRAR